MRHISAADANRSFSKLLREVQGGEAVTVTSHGRPVAVISPAVSAATSESDSAKARLLLHLKAQKPLGLTFRRDELYEEPA
ncbi:MAG: type II toxin-antitoxin system prevent-host-death family antitoxin [Rhodospirillales bacterium]|nr:MAG: type II toxin-antitoxin system prevent-host-death family antitoxin [Rhodospirillales bacterium]